MRVPITAFSACNGLGRGTQEVLANLRAGVRGLRPCPLKVAFTTVCGVVPGELLAPGDAEAGTLTRQIQLGRLAYREIAEPVANAIVRWGPTRVGAVLGTSTGGIGRTEAAYFRWRDTSALPPDYVLEAHSFHSIAAWVRARSGIGGPTYVVSTACSSSAKVFASARRLIATGRCDAVLVGGVDSLTLTTVCGFHSLGASSATPCRPFSKARDGMNVGEGAAYLLLEREPAPDRGARAWLVGVGESNDAFHMSAPDPEGRGAAAAMQAALRDADLAADDIDYVNAHGTGTARNDTAEATAIARVLGRDVPVVSTKSYTGHALGAGGATEAMLSLLSIEHGFIPANLGLDPVDPEISIALPTERLDRPVRTVLSSSFAFGGSNVALVFQGASA